MAKANYNTFLVAATILSNSKVSKADEVDLLEPPPMLCQRAEIIAPGPIGSSGEAFEMELLTSGIVLGYLHEMRFQAIEKELSTIASLTHNWNSYGAPPLPKETINKTRSGLTALVELGFNPFRLSPTADGGIVAEFNHGEVRYVIEFGEDENVGILQKHGSSRNAVDTSIRSLGCAMRDLASVRA